MSIPHQFKLTWAAILCCLLLTIPGLFIGGIVAEIYRYFLNFFVGGNNIITWLGLENVMTVWFSALLHGMIAGALAIMITGKILKHADYNVVAYSSSTLVVAVAILSAVFIFNQGLVFEIDTVFLISNTLGTIIGYFIGQLDIVKPSYQSTEFEPQRVERDEGNP